ncbi:hypothetical protein COLO4_26601 [Corchorus olitorius]|uniref:Uncharacterized protein n=1 Tax=Corchorus olitorius TaxID=93759 RepID=A0A1R3HW67_9ROSI|nr:hypothetical protein COLO4_26601 [Corchorus olitorius]
MSKERKKERAVERFRERLSSFLLFFLLVWCERVFLEWREPGRDFDQCAQSQVVVSQGGYV